MNNFTRIGMPILVVLFLLIAAISITMTVTRDSILKQVAAASNTPVTTIETQLARTAPEADYVGNGQPVASVAEQSAVSSTGSDYNSAGDSTLPICHGSGVQVNGTPTVYQTGGCGGGKCGGNSGQISRSVSGPTGGASCH